MHQKIRSGRNPTAHFKNQIVNYSSILSAGFPPSLIPPSTEDFIHIYFSAQLLFSDLDQFHL